MTSSTQTTSLSYTETMQYYNPVGDTLVNCEHIVTLNCPVQREDLHSHGILSVSTLYCPVSSERGSLYEGIISENYVVSLCVVCVCVYV